MLKTRVITALLMLAVLLLAVFAFPDWAWGVATLAVMAAACWEWSRFSQASAALRGAWLALSAVFAAIVLAAYVQGHVGGIRFRDLAIPAFIVASVFWIAVATIWLARGWRAGPWPILLAGWVVIFPMWMALLVLRGIGPWALLSFAAIVWIADISAYFVGRRFGKHKLAPAISPGKTREGAYGALAGVAIFFVVWWFIIGNTPVAEQAWARQARAHALEMFLLFMVLACLSVVGDLFESWMKRGAGLKDSSNLLPGHGGVLDRIDALTSTLPLAALCMMHRLGTLS